MARAIGQYKCYDNRRGTGIKDTDLCSVEPAVLNDPQGIVVVQCSNLVFSCKDFKEKGLQQGGNIITVAELLRQANSKHRNVWYYTGK